MSENYTREEQFLAAIAGEGTAPAPVTAREQLLKKIAESKGGGSTGGKRVTKVKKVLVQTRLEGQNAYTLSSVWVSNDKVKGIVGMMLCSADVADYDETTAKLPNYNSKAIPYSQAFGWPASYTEDGYIQEIVYTAGTMGVPYHEGQAYKNPRLVMILDCDE